VSPFLVCLIVVLAIWAGFTILWLGLKLTSK
jgi:hypothetical protein